MHGLEAVHVEQREGDARKHRAQPFQRFHQRHAIAEAGQRVARAALHLRRVDFLARGDVGQKTEAAFRPAAFADHRGAEFVPGIAVRFVQGAEFDAKRDADMAFVIVDGLAIGGAVVGMDALDPYACGIVVGAAEKPVSVAASRESRTDSARKSRSNTPWCDAPIAFKSVVSEPDDDVVSDDIGGSSRSEP